jgi:3-phosphoshikimate 1-carboxyvinyltransferase
MIRILPAREVSGEICVPGDKSISHRALILAALAAGASEVENLSEGRDVRSTAAVLRKLGVKIMEDGWNRVRILGCGRFGFREPPGILYCGNSGTTARLMAAVLTGQRFFSVLAGDTSLSRRPMKRVVEPLQRMGARIEGRQGGEFLPLAISGAELRGIRYRMPVASAQVKTALLLAGLLAEGETRISEPSRSRDHTERVFRWLGIDFSSSGLQHRVRPSQIRAFRMKVPGDFSSAAFFLALAVLHPRAELTIHNVNLNPTRTGFLRVLQRMGAEIRITVEDKEPEPVGSLHVRSSALKNVPVPAEEIPQMIDELPLLGLVAACAEGVLELRGARELRVKESDRIAALVSQLRRMGASIEERDDGFFVEGPAVLKGCRLRSFGDHRIAMTLAVAASIARGESLLAGEAWIRISFPAFFATLKAIGGQFE